jgi:hypothetical protein
MNVIYAPDKIHFVGRSIFLAGPTPRLPTVESWRPQAIEILDKLHFVGTVLVPENKDGPKFDYITQVEWEGEGLENCSHIVFWVPRKIDTMPAFTTNVEFGSYVRSGRAIYGRPDNCPCNKYLDWLYNKVTGLKPYNDLHTLLSEVAWMYDSKL